MMAPTVSGVTENGQSSLLPRKSISTAQWGMMCCFGHRTFSALGRPPCWDESSDRPFRLTFFQCRLMGVVTKVFTGDGQQNGAPLFQVGEGSRRPEPCLINPTVSCQLVPQRLVESAAQAFRSLFFSPFRPPIFVPLSAPWLPEASMFQGGSLIRPQAD